MKKAILIILILLLLCPAACAKKPADGPAQTEAPEATAFVPPATAGPTPGATPEPAVTPEPTPQPDPTAAEALRIAKKYGLSGEDLRGEYELFLRFSETAEHNSGLDGYRGLVYLIFPVITDHAEFMDPDHFFDRLSVLRFTVRELELGVSGLYQYEPNLISINTEFGESDISQLPSVVFHELMHFVDFSMTGAPASPYLLDGELLSAEGFMALPLADQIRAVILYPAEPVKEGGAELYTAKYLAGATRTYFNTCSFLTGLEHIYGAETLDELFFSHESDALFAKLLLDAGYDEDRYHDACSSLNWLTDPNANFRPDRYILPEDILIDLYGSRLGDGWRTDEEFLYILKYLNGIAWSGYMESPRADFLGGIQFATRDQYEAFEANLYSALPYALDVRYTPPSPVIRNGRFTLAAFAEWTDPDTQTLIHGTISAEYDFEAEQPTGYGSVDMDAMLDRYFTDAQ